MFGTLITKNVRDTTKFTSREVEMTRVLINDREKFSKLEIGVNSKNTRIACNLVGLLYHC